MERELSRAIFSADWLSKIPTEKKFDTFEVNEFHSDKLVQPIRYGESKASLGTDTPIFCLGPINKVVSLKTRMKQRAQKAKENGDDIAINEDDEGDGSEESQEQLPETKVAYNRKISIAIDDKKLKSRSAQLAESNTRSEARFSDSERPPDSK